MMRLPDLRRFRLLASRTVMIGVFAALSLGVAAFGAGLLAAAARPHGPAGVVPPGLITAGEWEQYRSCFIDAGRVIDNANGGISHSEGQGYGMLLAVMADDRATFAALWSFVRTQLLIRDDGLAAWGWNPSTRPHVSDVNNASDGDILIAYALLLGAETWKKPDLAAAARKIIDAVAEKLVFQAGGRTLLLPGADGFSAGARPDGPVVNPSYWVFEALHLFAQLAPDSGPWAALARDGLALIDEARFGPAVAPSEWVSARRPRKPRPAEGFAAEYGYNALRIPLYLLRAGVDDRARLDRFKRLWTWNGEPAPALIGLKAGAPATKLDDPGYAMIAAALSCAIDGKTVPEALQQFTPTLYYPSTLHLLGLSMVRQRYPQCL